jgi:autotransporter translocation and assembly factor TamB
VARALDLDQFDIRPADTGRGASVVVGRQINERLFVGFRQDIGQTEASQLTLELRLNEYLRLVTSLAQGADVTDVRRRAETAGLDLFFVIR